MNSSKTLSIVWGKKIALLRDNSLKRKSKC
jgi:hypothetical protein